MIDNFTEGSDFRKIIEYKPPENIEFGEEDLLWDVSKRKSEKQKKLLKCHLELNATNSDKSFLDVQLNKMNIFIYPKIVKKLIEFFTIEKKEDKVKKKKKRELKATQALSDHRIEQIRKQHKFVNQSIMISFPRIEILESEKITNRNRIVIDIGLITAASEVRAKHPSHSRWQDFLYDHFQITFHSPEIIIYSNPNMCTYLKREPYYQPSYYTNKPKLGSPTITLRENEIEEIQEYKASILHDFYCKITFSLLICRPTELFPLFRSSIYLNNFQLKFEPTELNTMISIAHAYKNGLIIEKSKKEIFREEKKKIEKTTSKAKMEKYKKREERRRKAEELNKLEERLYKIVEIQLSVNHFNISIRNKENANEMEFEISRVLFHLQQTNKELNVFTEVNEIQLFLNSMEKKEKLVFLQTSSPFLLLQMNLNFVKSTEKSNNLNLFISDILVNFYNEFSYFLIHFLNKLIFKNLNTKKIENKISSASGDLDELEFFDFEDEDGMDSALQSSDDDSDASGSENPENPDEFVFSDENFVLPDENLPEPLDFSLPALLPRPEGASSPHIHKSQDAQSVDSLIKEKKEKKDKFKSIKDLRIYFQLNSVEFILFNEEKHLLCEGRLDKTQVQLDKKKARTKIAGKMGKLNIRGENELGDRAKKQKLVWSEREKELVEFKVKIITPLKGRILPKTIFLSLAKLHMNFYFKFYFELLENYLIIFRNIEKIKLDNSEKYQNQKLPHSVAGFSPLEVEKRSPLLQEAHRAAIVPSGSVPAPDRKFNFMPLLENHLNFNFLIHFAGFELNLFKNSMNFQEKLQIAVNDWNLVHQKKQLHSFLFEIKDIHLSKIQSRPSSPLHPREAKEGERKAEEATFEHEEVYLLHPLKFNVSLDFQTECDIELNVFLSRIQLHVDKASVAFILYFMENQKNEVPFYVERMKTLQKQFNTLKKLNNSLHAKPPAENPDRQAEKPPQKAQELPEMNITIHFEEIGVLMETRENSEIQMRIFNIKNQILFKKLTEMKFHAQFGLEIGKNHKNSDKAEEKIFYFNKEKLFYVNGTYEQPNIQLSLNLENGFHCFVFYQHFFELMEFFMNHTLLPSELALPDPLVAYFKKKQELFALENQVFSTARYQSALAAISDGKRKQVANEKHKKHDQTGINVSVYANMKDMEIAIPLPTSLEEETQFNFSNVFTLKFNTILKLKYSNQGLEYPQRGNRERMEVLFSLYSIKFDYLIPNTTNIFNIFTLNSILCKIYLQNHFKHQLVQSNMEKIEISIANNHIQLINAFVQYIQPQIPAFLLSRPTNAKNNAKNKNLNEENQSNLLHAKKQGKHKKNKQKLEIQLNFEGMKLKLFNFIKKQIHFVNQGKTRRNLKYYYFPFLELNFFNISANFINIEQQFNFLLEFSLNSNYFNRSYSSFEPVVENTDFSLSLIRNLSKKLEIKLFILNLMNINLSKYFYNSIQLFLADIQSPSPSPVSPSPYPSPLNPALRVPLRSSSTSVLPHLRSESTPSNLSDSSFSNFRSPSIPPPSFDPHKNNEILLKNEIGVPFFYSFDQFNRHREEIHSFSELLINFHLLEFLSPSNDDLSSRTLSIFIPGFEIIHFLPFHRIGEWMIELIHSASSPSDPFLSPPDPSSPFSSPSPSIENIHSQPNLTSDSKPLNKVHIQWKVELINNIRIIQCSSSFILFNHNHFPILISFSSPSPVEFHSLSTPTRSSDPHKLAKSMKSVTNPLLHLNYEDKNKNSNDKTKLLDCIDTKPVAAPITIDNASISVETLEKVELKDTESEKKEKESHPDTQEDALSSPELFIKKLEHVELPLPKWEGGKRSKNLVEYFIEENQSFSIPLGFISHYYRNGGNGEIKIKANHKSVKYSNTLHLFDDNSLPGATRAGLIYQNIDHHRKETVELVHCSLKVHPIHSDAPFIEDEAEKTIRKKLNIKKRQIIGEVDAKAASDTEKIYFLMKSVEENHKKEITLSAPIEIENLLSESIHFTIKQGSNGPKNPENIENKIKSGEKKEIYLIKNSEDTEIQYSTKGYESTKWIAMKKNEIHQVELQEMHDPDRKILFYQENKMNENGKMKMKIISKYWILNKSGLPLQFSSFSPRPKKQPPIFYSNFLKMKKANLLDGRGVEEVGARPPAHRIELPDDLFDDSVLNQESEIIMISPDLFHAPVYSPGFNTLSQNKLFKKCKFCIRVNFNESHLRDAPSLHANDGLPEGILTDNTSKNIAITSIPTSTINDKYISEWSFPISLESVGSESYIQLKSTNKSKSHLFPAGLLSFGKGKSTKQSEKEEDGIEYELSFKIELLKNDPPPQISKLITILPKYLLINKLKPGNHLHFRQSESSFGYLLPANGVLLPFHWYHSPTSSSSSASTPSSLPSSFAKLLTVTLPHLYSWSPPFKIDEIHKFTLKIHKRDEEDIDKQLFPDLDHSSIPSLQYIRVAVELYQNTSSFLISFNELEEQSMIHYIIENCTCYDINYYQLDFPDYKSAIKPYSTVDYIFDIPNNCTTITVELDCFEFKKDFNFNKLKKYPVVELVSTNGEILSLLVEITIEGPKQIMRFVDTNIHIVKDYKTLNSNNEKEQNSKLRNLRKKLRLARGDEAREEEEQLKEQEEVKKVKKDFPEMIKDKLSIKALKKKIPPFEDSDEEDNIELEEELDKLIEEEKMESDIKIEGICISIVDDSPKELILLTIRDIRLKHGKTIDKTFVELKIFDVEIDNQLIYTNFPILASRSVHSNLKENLFHFCMIKSNYNENYFHYFSLLLQEVDLQLEDAVINDLIYFFNLHKNQHKKIDLEKLKKPLNQENYERNKEIKKKEKEKNNKFYFEIFHINSFKFNLSLFYSGYPEGRKLNFFMNLLNSIGITVGNINRAPIRLNAIIIKNIYENSKEIVSTISKHFYFQFLFEFYKVLGSFEFIGNPVNFINHLGIGVYDFFYEPIKGIVSSPNDFVFGFYRGSSSLFKNLIFSLFSSASVVSKSLSSGVSQLSLDSNYIQLHQKLQNQNAENLSDGLLLGTRNLYFGVSKGLSGLFVDPIVEGKQFGVSRAIQSTAKGFIGLFIKPTIGVVDFATKTTEGIKNTTTFFDYFITRYRPPRSFSPDRLLYPFSLSNSIGFSLLRLISSPPSSTSSASAHSSTEWFLFYCIADNSQLFISSNESIYLVDLLQSNIDFAVIWSCKLLGNFPFPLSPSPSPSLFLFTFFLLLCQ